MIPCWICFATSGLCLLAPLHRALSLSLSPSLPLSLSLSPSRLCFLVSRFYMLACLSTLHDMLTCASLCVAIRPLIPFSSPPSLPPSVRPTGIIDKASMRTTDTVLEIGPGTGKSTPEHSPFFSFFLSFLSFLVQLEDKC